MSDGQSEACESIQQQSRATCCRVDVSQEAYTWQDDDGGWHVGRMLWRVFFLGGTEMSEWIMHDNTGQHWRVCESRLKLYGPRCGACGGEGTYTTCFGNEYGPYRRHVVQCPSCKGTGRSGNTMSVEQFGAKGDGVTDDTEAFQDSQRASQCHECGGEGKLTVPVLDPFRMIMLRDATVDCPACGGSGRRSS